MVLARNIITIQILLISAMCQTSNSLLSEIFSLYHMEKAHVTTQEELSNIWWQIQVFSS